jgi:hypothetical protein
MPVIQIAARCREGKKRKTTERNKIKRTSGNSHDQSSRHMKERKGKKRKELNIRSMTHRRDDRSAANPDRGLSKTQSALSN